MLLDNLYDPLVMMAAFRFHQAGLQPRSACLYLILATLLSIASAQITITQTLSYSVSYTATEASQFVGVTTSSDGSCKWIKCIVIRLKVYNWLLTSTRAASSSCYAQDYFFTTTLGPKLLIGCNPPTGPYVYWSSCNGTTRLGYGGSTQISEIW